MLQRAAHLVLVLLAGAVGAHADTSLFVRLRPSGCTGLEARIALDLTHADTTFLNRVTLIGFSHDGSADAALAIGGPAYGDLMSGANPAQETRFEGQAFYNSLIIPFHGFGTSATWRLSVTESAPVSGAIVPDELSLYLLSGSTGLAYPTSDGLSSNALFALDISGQSGGELSVFSPMVFIPPDTLALDGPVTAVPSLGLPPARLRLIAVSPNPASHYVRLTYSQPPPGGTITVQVYDLHGRLIARPFVGHRPAGTWETSWDGRDVHGRALSSGVYLVEIKSERQSLVRRVVLTR